MPSTAVSITGGAALGAGGLLFAQKKFGHSHNSNHAMSSDMGDNGISTGDSLHFSGSGDHTNCCGGSKTQTP